MPAPSIATRLARVQERIETACRRAGRKPSEVTLVAVSKTFPLDRLREAVEAGVEHLGESRAKEFANKFDRWQENPAAPVEWHFVGHIQRNKVPYIVGRASLIHSLDSRRLAKAIQKEAEKQDVVVPVLIQVNVSGEESKYGIELSDVDEFVGELGAFSRLRPRGLMTLASPGNDAEKIRNEFRLLWTCYDHQVRSGRPFECLSMGMSNDFELAIEEGATHVRVGSAVFGARSNQD